MLISLHGLQYCHNYYRIDVSPGIRFVLTSRVKTCVYLVTVQYWREYAAFLSELIRPPISVPAFPKCRLRTCPDVPWTLLSSVDLVETFLRHALRQPYVGLINNLRIK